MGRSFPRNKTHADFVLSDRKKVIMTHNDLDGISCKIVANMFLDTTARNNYEQVFPSNWDHIFPSVSQLEKYITKHGVCSIGNNPFLTNPCDYLITDLNVSEKLAKWIAVLNNSREGSKIWILDHHTSGMKIAKYPWCYVDASETKSATELIYDLYRNIVPYSQFASRYFTGEDKTLDIYVRAVSAYDIGDFGSEYGQLGIFLNRAFVEMGWERYADVVQNALFTRMPNVSESGLMEFSEDNGSITVVHMPREIIVAAKRRMLKDEARYESTVEAAYRMNSNNFGDFTVVAIIGSSFGNDVNSYRYLTEHEDVDILATINLVSGTCSIRTIKDINLAKIASKYGGGGHKRAAAFKFTPTAVLINCGSNSIELTKMTDEGDK